ncbi:MAG: J domain-containing protein [Armatimonadota bacterium]|nr:J domain-containing protein [Armatimonadota bacterium]
MAKLDFYNILGIDSDATQAEIKRAFRRMVRVSHPDLNPEDLAASERLKEIVIAYETLGDPIRRLRYDRINDLFGPTRRSREEVAEEKAFTWGYGNGYGPVDLTSLMMRKAQARKAAVISAGLLLLACLIIILGLMSDGFTRNPFRWAPTWRPHDGWVRTSKAPSPKNSLIERTDTSFLDYWTVAQTITETECWVIGVRCWVMGRESGE